MARKGRSVTRKGKKSQRRRTVRGGGVLVSKFNDILNDSKYKQIRFSFVIDEDRYENLIKRKNEGDVFGQLIFRHTDQGYDKGTYDMDLTLEKEGGKLSFTNRRNEKEDFTQKARTLVNGLESKKIKVEITGIE